MSETRPPEAMPVEWTVASFSHERGFGTLVHPSGEQVTFNIDAWNLGSWTPSRKEAAVTGAASPLLPQQGEEHADWIYTDDHRWDRERAQRTLPAMLGPAPGSVPAAGDGHTTGQDESLPDYVAKCNAAADREGRESRLHDVALDGDAFVFVALTPAAFAALVKDSYLEPGDA